MLAKQTLGIYAIDTYIIIFVSLIIQKLWFWPIAVVIDLCVSYVITLFIQRCNLMSRLFLGVYSK